MNLVDLLKNQMAGEVTKQLGGMLGTSEADTGNLLKASLPAILAGLGSVASKKDGADKLAQAIGGIDPGMLGNLGKMLGGADAKKGGDLLSGLLGNNMLTSLLPLLAKFVKLDSSLITKALGLIAPLVLSSIGSAFKGQKIDGSGISRLFSEQKGNIASAIPAGLSLASLPGLESLGDVGKMASQAVNQAGRTAGKAAQEASGGLGKLLLPLLALAAIIGGIIWFMNNGAKKVEDAAKGAAKGAVKAGEKVVAGATEAAKEVVTAGEKAVAGATAAAKDMIGEISVPGFSDLQKGFSGMFDSVGPKLQGIKDAASAEAALPDLESAITGLDGMVKTLGGMPDVAKSAVSTMVKGQLDKLAPVIDGILGMPGMGEKVVSVLNSLKDKLSGLVLK
ncbi:MAG: DUF937 domain-containing protein [Planctomycetota bacterium]|jgi:hypothetical protein|nr:DUF937 domain-containing protein [Blastopirellula sp.]